MEDSVHFKDAHIEDREYVLKETQNVDVIKSSLGHDFLIGDDENIFHTSNQYLSIPIYNETDKYGILFTSKGGSSLIEGVIEQYNLSVLNEFSDRKWMDTFKNFLSAERCERDLKVWKELGLISEGKSKKI